MRASRYYNASYYSARYFAAVSSGIAPSSWAQVAVLGSSGGGLSSLISADYQFTIGDDWEIVRSLSLLFPNDTVQRAWFTMRNPPGSSELSPAPAPTVVVEITPIYVVDVGRIFSTPVTIRGQTVQPPVLWFEVARVKTSSPPLFSTATYSYDIQVLLSGDKIKTIERGTIIPMRQETLEVD